MARYADPALLPTGNREISGKKLTPQQVAMLLFHMVYKNSPDTKNERDVQIILAMEDVIKSPENAFQSDNKLFDRLTALILAMGYNEESRTFRTEDGKPALQNFLTDLSTMEIKLSDDGNVEMTKAALDAMKKGVDLDGLKFTVYNYESGFPDAVNGLIGKYIERRPADQWYDPTNVETDEKKALGWTKYFDPNAGKVDTDLEAMNAVWFIVASDALLKNAVTCKPSGDILLQYFEENGKRDNREVSEILVLMADFYKNNGGKDGGKVTIEALMDIVYTYDYSKRHAEEEVATKKTSVKEIVVTEKRVPKVEQPPPEIIAQLKACGFSVKAGGMTLKEMESIITTPIVITPKTWDLGHNYMYSRIVRISDDIKLAYKYAKKMVDAINQLYGHYKKQVGKSDQELLRDDNISPPAYDDIEENVWSPIELHGFSK